jgi:hypothetical protein
VMKFDISAGTWSSPLTTTTNVANQAQHTHDDAGRRLRGVIPNLHTGL